MVQGEIKYRTEIKSRHSVRRSRSSAERCYPIFHALQNPVSLAIPSWEVWSWWDADWCSSSHHTRISRDYLSPQAGFILPFHPVWRVVWRLERWRMSLSVMVLARGSQCSHTCGRLKMAPHGSTWILLLLKGLQRVFCGLQFRLKNTNPLGTPWIKIQYILAWSSRDSREILSPELSSRFCHFFVCAVLLSSSEFSSWVLQIQHSTGKNEDFKPSRS